MCPQWLRNTAIFGWLAVAGAQEQPHFEVASVRLTEGADSVAIKPRRSGNRISYITTLDMVLNYTYQVQPFQVSGQLLDGIYDIEATMAGSPDETQIRRMLQTLLAERFGLKLHRETKEARGWELVLDKKGARLKATQEKSQIMLDATPAPPGVGVWSSRTGPRLIGKSATMPQLAESLSTFLHAPVADQTRLAGMFDFDVAFAIEDPRAPLPSLNVAIQEQLGLKLVESNKVPVEVLVIDRVEKPTEN